MTDYITNDTDLTSVANAIRVKAEISGSLEFPSGFISAINAISTGGMTVTRTPDAGGGDVLSITGTATEIEPLSVTANGTYTAPSGKAYSPVTVDVSAGVPTVKCGEIIETSTGEKSIDTGYTGNGFPLVFAILQMGGFQMNSTGAGMRAYAKFKPDVAAQPNYSLEYGYGLRAWGTSSGGSADHLSVSIFYPNAYNNANLCLVMSDASTIKAYFGDTQNSFKTNVRYCWVVAYSE